MNRMYVTRRCAWSSAIGWRGFCA